MLTFQKVFLITENAEHIENTMQSDFQNLRETNSNFFQLLQRLQSNAYQELLYHHRLHDLPEQGSPDGRGGENEASGGR